MFYVASDIPSRQSRTNVEISTLMDNRPACLVSYFAVWNAADIDTIRKHVTDAIETLGRIDALLRQAGSSNSLFAARCRRRSDCRSCWSNLV